VDIQEEESLKYTVQNLLEKPLLHAIAEAQKKQVELQLLMLNMHFDRNYAEKLGVDIENLIFLNLIMENRNC
jgi:hypothetical protein